MGVFTPVLLKTSMAIKYKDLKSSYTYSSLYEDSTDEEVLNLSQAINSLQDRDLDYVIKTKRYEYVEV